MCSGERSIWGEQVRDVVYADICPSRAQVVEVVIVINDRSRNSTSRLRSGQKFEIGE